MGVELLDRVVHLGGAALGEVAATSAVVVHEEQIAREERAADVVGEARGCVARRGDGPHGERAGLERLAIGDEHVELAAVGGEVREREDVLERRLHLLDRGADDDTRVEATSKELRAREVIGVRVRLEREVQAELLARHELAQPIDRLGVREGTDGLVVEHRIDRDGVAGRLVEHDVAEREGAGIEEGLDTHDGPRFSRRSWGRHRARCGRVP